MEQSQAIQVIKDLTELLIDRETDLLFEYNKRIAAEKRISELEAKNAEFQDRISHFTSLINHADQLLKDTSASNLSDLTNFKNEMEKFQ